MESTEVIVARLVLGYLKREHCKKAYEHFLRTSESLGEHSSNRSKYISTRFIGLTLEDILTEYFEISRIVQGRLEPTDYFNEGHSKTSLVKQLLYLLNKAHSSRASTPCPRSPLDSNLDETSPSYIDQVSDVEATPAHSLPGNSQYERDESYIYKNSRRKAPTKYVKVGPATSSPVMEKEEIFANKLLENREFHEKIAQTINKYAEKQFKNSAELDKTIKTVMKKTEEDPIFNRILEEIIGSSNHLDDENIAFETGSTTSSNAHKTDRRSRDIEPEYENACKTTEYQSVDQQNNDAVQSIIASSQMNTHDQQVAEAPNNAQQTVEKQNNEQVVVFDGSLDKYLRSDNSCLSVVPSQPMQNPLYINTTATLFIPTNAPRYSNIDSRQQLVVGPAVNWTAPGIITESDILTMPTVILSDNMSDATPVSTNESESKKHLKPILPTTCMPRIEIAANLSEYLKLNDIGNAKPKTGLKKVHYPKSTPTVTVTSATTTTLSNAKETIPKTTTLANSNDTKPPDEKKEPKKEQAPGACMPTTCTPPSLQQIKKSTPKSGSHVRNLDFSSPPKITSTHKKTARLKLGGKSPQFVHKKQAAKLLFKEAGVWDADLRAICPQDDKRGSPKAKRVVKKRVNNKEALSQKRKRASGEKKTKKKVKVTEVMNTTDQVAAQVEAALQTPVKKEEVKKEEDADNPTLPKNSETETKDADKNMVQNQKPSKDSSENNDAEQTNETPETLREVSSRPVKANRNILPLLETPLKDHLIPKTPGLATPSDMNLSALNFTPFSKMLEDNLKGIDIDSLPTPSMPITPNFPPFTPTVDLISPFSNRPTDYSTSSSYYQPSDNEQNKSLEAQLREAEKKSPMVDKVKSIFNKNVIGKKNLNLMRRESPDNSSTNSSVSEGDSHSLWGEKESNDTVILKKKDVETPRRMYSLRNRSVSLETAKKDSRKDAANKRNSDSKKVGKNSDQNEEASTSTEHEVRNKGSQKTKEATGATKDTEGKPVKRSTASKKTSNKKKIVFEDEETDQERKPKGKEEQGSTKKTPKAKKLSAAKQVKSKRLSVEVESSEVIEMKLKEAVSKSGAHEDEEKLKNAAVTEHAADKDVEDADKDAKVVREAQEKRNSPTIGEEVESVVHEDSQRSTSAVHKTLEVSAHSETGEKTESFTTSAENSVKVSESLETGEKQESSTTSKGITKDLSKFSKVQKSVDVSASSKAGEKNKSFSPREEVTDDLSDITKAILKTAEGSASLDTQEKKESSSSKDFKKSTKLQKTVEVSASLETGEKKKQTCSSEKVEDIINRDPGQSTKLSASSETHDKKESSTTSKKIKDTNRASMVDALKADKLDKKSSVLRELEEKRQRMISKLKEVPETKNTTTSKKQVNGKFKIKPIPNLTSVCKKPRKSDSPKKRVRYKMRHLFSSDEDSDDDTPIKPDKDESKAEKVVSKSESDVEAQNLIEGLKERGIHLMHNKSPKKKNEDTKEESLAAAEDSANCSSSRIDTFVRDTYDTKCFEGEDEHVMFDDEQVVETSNSYRIDEHAPKSFIGKLYLEGLGEEIDVPLTFSPFKSLFDMPSEENLSNAGETSDVNLSKKIIIKEMVIIKDDKTTYERILSNENVMRKEDRNRGCIVRDKSIGNTVTAENVEEKPERIAGYEASEQTSVVEDDLMNFASTGKEKDFQERSLSPIIGTKKRKLSDGSNHHTEKKAKKLLKNLDVDSFLNNIHAGTHFPLRK